MPFSITCPSCSVKLKTAAALPNGRSIQCPKCKTSFAISPDNMVEVGASATGGAAPSSAAVRKAPGGSNPVGALDAPVGRKSNRDDDETPRAKKRTADDDNERPRSKRRVDDEDEKPRARKPLPLDDDDDEEDRPKAKKRRNDDDEDDDRPKAKKRRDEDDDDEDDRPKAKKRRDEDDDDRPAVRKRQRDDDDDRPRKKLKKKKKGSNIGIVIGLAVFGVVALGGVSYLVYSLLFGGGNYDTEMLAYMPAGTNIVYGIEVEELMRNEKAKSLVKKATQSAGGKFEVLKKAGITEDDISRILIGASVGKKETSRNSVMVVRLKKSVTPDKAAKSMGATEQKKNDKTYYKFGKAGSQDCLYFPDDTMLVLAENEKAMEQALSGSSKVLISQELQDFAKKMSGGQIWMAMVDPDPGNSPADDLKDLKLPPEVEAVLKSARGLGAFAKLEADTVTLNLALLCADSNSPAKAADPLEKNLKSDTGAISTLKGTVGLFVPELKKILDDIQKSAQVKSDGNLLQLTTTISMGSIEPAVNKAMEPPKIQQPVPEQANPEDKQAEPKKQEPKKRGKKQTGALLAPQRWSKLASAAWKNNNLA